MMFGIFGSPAVGGSNYVSFAKAPLSLLEKVAEDPSPCPLPAGERIQAAYGIRHKASGKHNTDALPAHLR